MLVPAKNMAGMRTAAAKARVREKSGEYMGRSLSLLLKLAPALGDCDGLCSTNRVAGPSVYVCPFTRNKLKTDGEAIRGYPGKYLFYSRKLPEP
jgi:hypothetical protein